MSAPRTRRLARAAVAAALPVLALAACASSAADLERQMTTRPPMEQVADHYDAMRREMVQALDSVGVLVWREDDENLGLSRAGCSRDGVLTDAQDMNMVGLVADGAHEPADRHRSAEIVLEIGRRYGFAETGTLVDRPGDLEVVARDEHGAVYHYGVAVNTVLTLRTGCHLWDDEPGADYARPSLLDRTG